MNPINNDHWVLGILPGKEGVLPGCLDVAAPPRFTSQVYDRGPESRVAVASVHQSASLTSDLSARQLPQGAVEAHAHGDRKSPEDPPRTSC